MRTLLVPLILLTEQSLSMTSRLPNIRRYGMGDSSIIRRIHVELPAAESDNLVLILIPLKVRGGKKSATAGDRRAPPPPL